MAVASGLIGAALGLIPAAIGGLFFLGPYLRKKETASGFVDTRLTLAALPEDGRPQLVTIIQDRVDAWNGFPNQPVGTIWLRRIGDQVIAFNTVCPHLGCSVDYRPSENDFYCPCHSSAFDIDGKKANSIPPRSMDDLEVNVEDGRILVRYVNYRAGETEKVPV